jgi:carbon-monoxide dehydrogenase medium subunit
MTPAFLQPRSTDEALEALSQYGYDAKVIAGGTAVVLMLQQQLIAPQVLVSLQHIPGLDTVREEADGLHIGPMRTLHDVARLAPVRRRYPALAMACSMVGNIRVRHQATLAGNLAEADYASDPPAVLTALDASVTVAGPRGVRNVPISSFFLGFYATALEPDELIMDVTIPPLTPNSRMTYRKYTTRSSEDRPAVGVAVVATVEDGVCNDLRIAVGAATATPQRLPDVEEMASDQMLDEALMDSIGEEYAKRLDALDDLRASSWYRSQMIRIQVRRALEKVRDGHR